MKSPHSGPSLSTPKENGALTFSKPTACPLRSVAQEASYAREFSEWIRQAVLEGDEDRLVNALERAPHARRAHPTTEHFLPLLVAAGAASTPVPATVLDGGIRHGVLAMESYVFGHRIALQVEEAAHA